VEYNKGIMGEPEMHILDSEIPYFRRPELLLIKGEAVQDEELTVIENPELSDVEIDVNARAPRFFNLDKGIAAAPYPYNDEKRLFYLRRSLLTIPNLDMETLRWADPTHVELKPRHKTIGSIESLQNRKIKHNLNIDQDNDHPSTYLDAFRIPEISTPVLTELHDKEDPVIKVIDLYQKWRFEEKEPDFEYELDSAGHILLTGSVIEKVERSYEHFIFAAKGTGFLALLKEATVSYLEEIY
jgi:hypothetical protein